MFAPPPTELNAALIHHCFGRLHAEQGGACARAGAVTLESVQAVDPLEPGTPIEIAAKVQDSRLQPFASRLYYQAGGDWPLSGECDCPAGSDCKHCAAVAFAWMYHRPEPVASDSEWAQWLQALQQSTVTRPEGPLPSQIIYILEPALQDEGFLQVQVAVRKRLPGPGQRWRSPIPLPAGDIEGQLGARGNDREIAAVLRSLQPGMMGRSRPGQNLTLKGRMGALALDLMLESGRAYGRVGVDQVRDNPLQAAPARKMQVVWQAVPGGQQLKPQLDPPASHYFTLGAHLYYLDSERDQIGRTAIPPAQMALLQKAPVVASSAVPRITQALGKVLPEAAPPESPITEHRIPAGALVPVLSLQGSPTGAHQALLQFAYGSQRLDADPQQPAEVVIHKGEHIYRIQRNPIGEQQARQQLLQSELIPLANDPTRFGFAESQALEGLPSPYVRAWHHWMQECLPALKAQGWLIEMDDSFRLQFLPSPAWQAELVASSPEEKWFDLALGIDLNGERVDLLPLLVRLLKTVPDPKALRQELEQHDVWLLPLDPHPMQQWAARSTDRKLPQRWLEVPTRRLVRMLDLLVELYDYLPGKEDTLGLSAFAALQVTTQVQLNPDDYGVQWQAPPGLKAAAQQLAGHPQDGWAEVPPPTGLQATLRPYQQRGLNWLQTLRSLGLNGILADDMGLGKTLQTLAHLLVEKQAGRLTTPALVVAPTSVLENWRREAQRFAPDLRCLLLHGPDRNATPEAIAQADLVLTSYTLLRQDAPSHRATVYTWLILDEAQNIKNPRSRTALVACAQPAKHRLCLSGTPVENHLEELWSLFHFLMPGFLETLERFKSRWQHPIERQGDTRRQALLRERVRPLMLRRRKREVERELPPKVEMVRTVTLGQAQRDLYETTRLAVDLQVNRILREKGLKRSRIMVLDALLKLRQICCHPQLLALPEAKKVKRSAKLELLMEMLPEMVQEGRRILIFSQFVTMLNLIESELQAAGITYELLTGQTRRRQHAIDRFQNGEVPVFLISLKAGGVGLNLTTADTVIHYDPWWNPASQQQAEDRAWRIGQTHPVFVYKLIAAGTVEERILMLQEAKHDLREQLFDADPAATLQMETLLGLLAQSS
jgi:superfamily II DNA or RNA helicase